MRTRELIQVVEQGYVWPDGSIEWTSGWSRPDTPANRDRILRREAQRGYRPGPDGWLTEPHRDIGDIRLDDGTSVPCVVVGRIRWEDAALVDPSMHTRRWTT